MRKILILLLNHLIYINATDDPFIPFTSENDTLLEYNTTTSEAVLEFELNEATFSKIVSTEAAKEILIASSKVSLQSDTQQEQWLLNKQQMAINGDQHGVVACDTDLSRTGGQRKALLLAQGFQKESIVTILNSQEKSCYIVHARDQEISRMPSDYAILPLSYAMKIRENTVSQVIASERLGSVEISALMFLKNKRSEFSSTSTSTYEKKLLSFTRNEVLSDSFFVPNRPNSATTLFFSSTGSNTELMAEACSQSYDLLQFTYVDVSRDNDLVKMGINSLEMENFLSKADLGEVGNIPVSEIFQNCLLSLVGSMSLLPEVVSIEVKPEYKTLNDQMQFLVQSFTERRYPWYDVGLTGKGEVIAISDSGIDINNCYFWDSHDDFKYGLHEIDLNQRKIVQYDPYEDEFDSLGGHGTHVAGTVAGRRAINGIDEDRGIADGVAWDAKIAFIDLGPEDNPAAIVFPPTERLLRTGHPYAKIHSASWGSFSFLTPTPYDEQAAEIDDYLYRNDDFLFVVAAGNFGERNQFVNVASPGVAKNVLTVGATNSNGPDISPSMKGPSHVAGFSSRGPTSDGRTKPDILAPGYFVLSAGAQPDVVGECDPADGDYPRLFDGLKDGLLSNLGTSMATPAVSGALAMIRQYFRDGFYPSGEKCPDDSMEPSNALMKAVILNGGQPLRGVDNMGWDTSYLQFEFPSVPYDNVQNYGRVSLEDTLYIKDKSDMKSLVYDKRTIMESDTKCFSVTVDHSDWCHSSIFSVTLVWMDKPGFPSCNEKCLMNDLDLYVIKNNNEHNKYYPNGLSVRDDRNTAERIRIHGVEHGDTLDIYVRGTNFDTLEDMQQYAVAVTGCVYEGHKYDDNHHGNDDDRYGKKRYNQKDRVSH